MTEYIQCMVKELEWLPLIKWKTIFIGGGTPTYLNLEQLKILKIALDTLQKSEDVEFTMECNPGTVTLEKLQLLRDMGVNRLSIGLQAWQEALLKRIGRIHDRKDFLQTLSLASQCGFDNINVDIMFGLPGQSVQDLEETIHEVCSLGLEHVSCYGLIIEEGTPFENMNEKGTIVLPDEEVERQMYGIAKEMLKRNGYHQYEISNFSKRGKECRHNLVYWRMGEYIGCGSGAHSFYEGERYSNAEEIEKYIELIRSKGNAVVNRYMNSLEDNIEEYMFMGLRTARGISTEEFSRRFSMNINSVYGKVINKYIGSGLLIKDKDALYLSEEGIEISNSIMSDFILDKK